jgi:hypothetical protein
LNFEASPRSVADRSTFDLNRRARFALTIRSSILLVKIYFYRGSPTWGERRSRLAFIGGGNERLAQTILGVPDGEREVGTGSVFTTLASTINRGFALGPGRRRKEKPARGESLAPSPFQEKKKSGDRADFKRLARRRLE